MDKYNVPQDSRPKRGLEDEGNDELDWVHKKIKVAVQEEKQREELAKYRAANKIGKEVKDNLDCIKRLSDMIKTGEEYIKAENYLISQFNEEAKMKEKTINEIGSQMKKLEKVQQETSRMLDIVHASAKTSKESIVQRSKEVAEQKQQKEELKLRVVELEEELVVLPRATGYSQEMVDDMESQIEGLAEHMQCPVCMEEFVLEVFTCPAQHPVCSICRPKMDSCGECREKYSMGMVRHR